MRAGQALQRLLLEATGQEYLRWLVRYPLTGGHLQIIMRLGYGPPAPATPRRPPEHVLAPSHFTERR